MHRSAVDILSIARRRRMKLARWLRRKFGVARIHSNVAKKGRYEVVAHLAAKSMLRITQSATAATTPALANTIATTTALNRITPSA
jgi:hypothetical protein